jgi:hypothetical protein
MAMQLLQEAACEGKLDAKPVQQVEGRKRKASGR